jgi:ABC-type nitrate/sulfonate/bicarbonate transport system permease component
VADESVAYEVIKPVKEKQAFNLLGALTNEYFLYVVSFVGFLAAWHFIAAAGLLGLATPEATIKELARMMEVKLAGKNLLGHIWASARRIFIGFSLGAVTGIPLGLFMALNRYVNATVKPVFDLFKPMPPIAWISIAILWFGIGEPSKIFIIFIGSFVPCVLNAYNGIRIIDPELYDVIRVLGGRRRDMIFQVSFPAALPALFAGLQISLSIAWTCVLAAELVSSRAGLGWIILRGMRLTKPELVLGGMAIIAMVAWINTLMVNGLERLVCPWKRQIKGL